MARPVAIDLCCGLGGWTEGLLSEGYEVRGYDIEPHEYGDEKYPAELVLKSILDLHGSEVADAALIVASPPCQEFSWMAMPWSRAKRVARALRGEDTFPDGYRGSRTLTELTALFDACFRIQREASEAAGRYIPLVVENVKGAQPWVGSARYNFGSFYLWGDTPALMPKARSRGASDAVKRTGRTMCFPEGSANPDAVRGRTGKTKNDGGSWFAIGSLGQRETNCNPVHDGVKNPGFRFDGSGKSFQTESVNGHIAEGLKVPALSSGRRTDVGNGNRFTSRDCGAERQVAEGIKAGGDWFNAEQPSISRLTSSKSPARKRASAQIAKIPFVLSSHVGRYYYPDE